MDDTDKPELPRDASLSTGTPTFLMVGTIEPRKGYAEVLDAFEKLWDAGEKAELWIVGKQGWKAEQLAARLESLSAVRPLTWYRSIPDDELEDLYRNAECLIAASLDEGFGLPLVEAAHHGLYLIARDIPVFREVCGDSATYFSSQLPNVLKSWLRDYRRGKARGSADLVQTSWDESVQTLLSEIFPGGTLGTRN